MISVKWLAFGTDGAHCSNKITNQHHLAWDHLLVNTHSILTCQRSEHFLMLWHLPPSRLYDPILPLRFRYRCSVDYDRSNAHIHKESSKTKHIITDHT